MKSPALELADRPSSLCLPARGSNSAASVIPQRYVSIVVVCQQAHIGYALAVSLLFFDIMDRAVVRVLIVLQVAFP
jgi:hypothetical protein